MKFQFTANHRDSVLLVLVQKEHRAKKDERENKNNTVSQMHMTQTTNEKKRQSFAFMTYAHMRAHKDTCNEHTRKYIHESQNKTKNPHPCKCTRNVPAFEAS